MKRIRELDGLRGCAVLLVLVWHCFANQARLPEFGFLLHFTKLAWSGVDLFFVLSGYLIAGILLDSKGEERYFGKFYIRRFFRIFPVYYALLLLHGVVSFLCYEGAVSPWNSFPRILTYLSLSQNFIMAYQWWPPAYQGVEAVTNQWLGVTWTLAVEEQFYLLIPCLIRFVPRKYLALIFVTGITLAPIFRLLDPGPAAKVLPWSRGDAILAGCLLAILVRSKRFRDLLDAQKYLLPLLFFGTLVVTAVFNFSGESYQGAPFIHLWLSFFFALVILICAHSDWVHFKQFFRFPPLIWLGTRSYTIYLTHEATNSLTHLWWHGGPPIFTGWMESIPTILALALSFLIAEVSFRAYETPCIRLGRKLTARV